MIQYNIYQVGGVNGEIWPSLMPIFQTKWSQQAINQQISIAITHNLWRQMSALGASPSPIRNFARGLSLFSNSSFSTSSPKYQFPLPPNTLTPLAQSLQLGRPWNLGPLIVVTSNQLKASPSLVEIESDTMLNHLSGSKASFYFLLFLFAMRESS